MCPSPHNIGPNPPNMVKHSALSIVPTEYIEKIHQLLLLIFLRPRSVTGNLGSECKYRVLGPDYSINPPEYKSFKAFCEPFDLSLSYVKTSCQLPLQHLVPLRYPRMSAKSPFWPTVFWAVLLSCDSIIDTNLKVLLRSGVSNQNSNPLT